MLKFVKEGALDLLAFTLPSSLLESIRQVSEDDFLAPQHSHRQRQPRPRISSSSSASSHRTVAASRRLRPIDSQQSSSRLEARHQDLPTTNVDGPMTTATCKTVISIPLPYEVLTLIFQFLPASDLFSILAVCRLWRQIALQETKHVDLSEGFPVDCLGLEENEYSDFDFVFNLFSIFPLISSLVIKDRYMRDRDLRVVTAGILAGKMAFTRPEGPVIGTTEYFAIRQAIHEQKNRQLKAQPSEDGEEERSVKPKEAIYNETEDALASSQVSTATTTTSPSSSSSLSKTTTKLFRGTIKEQLRDFSKSVGTYVLIPQTRKTLRKKILERLEQNLEQKEVQEYLWMQDNDIDPRLLPTTTAAYVCSTSDSDVDQKRYPLVPMTHYRFQDCCFANDWGAVMDLNKLPMIGLAAAISGQGLVVDLEGSYGAPSRSIKSMLGFCFGAHCVISLDLNFQHTHMELEHVVELLSENPILFKVHIVDSSAYQELIRLPALRGLGAIMEQMQDSCLDLDEQSLETHLQRARAVLLDLERKIVREEDDEKEHAGVLLNGVQEEYLGGAVATTATTAVETETGVATGHPAVRIRRVYDDVDKPVASLVRQLPFTGNASAADRHRTAKVLLKGVIDNGVIGLINTRDRQSGQSLLHALAWKRSYMSLVAQARSAAPPTPPFSTQQERGPFDTLSSSFPPKGYFSSRPHSGFFSSSPPRVSSPLVDQGMSEIAPLPSSEETSGSLSADQTSSSTLSTLRSISALPAALTSALSFRRRLSLPTSSIWIPQDSEDIGVGGGSLPTPDADGDEPEGVDALPSSKENNPCVVEEGPASTGKCVSSEPTVSEPTLVIPEQHPVAIALRMARSLLELKADPNVYNRDGRSAVVCASYMGFQPMETLLIEHGGYSKELIRIRETM
ncbi:hypothetical protein BGZ83_006388 [Gryganskiella cystojenkinii]|nr:hypothetical protein BGZ83_006388 [Gryganskiella cystojenkinii]